MQLSEKNPLRPDDDELLARYRADGRTEHLAQLYLRHTELVYGVAWHLKSVRSYIQNGKRNLKICLGNKRP